MNIFTDINQKVKKAVVETYTPADITAMFLRAIINLPLALLVTSYFPSVATNFFFRLYLAFQCCSLVGFTLAWRWREEIKAAKK